MVQLLQFILSRIRPSPFAMKKCHQYSIISHRAMNLILHFLIANM